MLTDIKSLLRQLKQENSFVNKFTYIFTSKSITLVIGFLLSPIITRWYDPEAYGIFAAANSIVVLVGIVAALRLPMFFTLPKKEDNFAALWQISFFSSVLISTIAGIICYSLRNQINQWLNVSLSPLVYISIGFAIFLYSFQEQVTHSAIRLNKFKSQSKIGVGTSLFNKGAALGLGFIFPGNIYGLYISENLTKLVYTGTTLIFSFKKNEVKELWVLRLIKVRYVWKKYRHLAVMNMGSGWLSTFVSQAVVLIITNFFTLSQLGAYSFASSLLYMPLKMLGEGAIGPLMLHKTAEIRKSSKDPQMDLRQVFEKFYAIFPIMAIPFLMLNLLGEQVFQFVFGEEWSLAGRLAQVMSVFYFYRLLATPCSSVVRVMRKEHFSLVIQSLFLITLFISYIIGYYYSSFILAVYLQTIFHTLLYIGYMYKVFELIEFNNKKLKVLIYIIIPSVFVLLNASIVI